MSFIKTLTSSSFTGVWSVRLVVISSDPMVCLTLNMTRSVSSVVADVGKLNWEADVTVSDTILVSSSITRESVWWKSERELLIYSKQQSA